MNGSHDDRMQKVDDLRAALHAVLDAADKVVDIVNDSDFRSTFFPERISIECAELEKAVAKYREMLA